jgi:hypothetical protein
MYSPLKEIVIIFYPKEIKGVAMIASPLPFLEGDAIMATP